MWKLIPQLYYDFLGRILPGATLILIGACVLSGPADVMRYVMRPPDDVSLFSIGALLVWLLASYVLGFVLGQAWEMTLRGPAARLERRLEQKRTKDSLEAHNKTLAALGLPTIAIEASDMPETMTMIEHLRACAPVEAARLVKIRAEKRFCQVLLLGLIALAVVSLARAFSQGSTDYFAGSVALLLTAWLCWQRGLRFHAHMTKGACIAWLLHGFKSPFSPPAGAGGASEGGETRSRNEAVSD